jgi:hypothetical protein
MGRRHVVMWALLLGACAGGDGDAPGPGGDSLLATGLYADVATGELGPGVEQFEPAFALWSDGAVKRRYVWLPEGGVIDTSDMDGWVLPVGTKLWKEFSRDGVRVETRLFEKRGVGDWRMVAYVWTEDGADALPAPAGQVDALGTPHDVPDQEACGKCHDGAADVALGFSALQLDHEGPGVTLDSATRPRAG